MVHILLQMRFGERKRMIYMFQHLLVPLDTLAEPTLLFQAATRIARHDGAEVHDCSTNTHDSASTILEKINYCHADLLIMGSDCGPEHDHPGKMALTERVVLATTIPVLLIRNAMGIRIPDAAHPFHTLMLLDGTPKAAHIIPALVASIQAFIGDGAGDITLLHIVQSVAE